MSYSTPSVCIIYSFYTFDLLMKVLVLLCLLMPFIGYGKKLSPFVEQFNFLLKNYVNDGLVHYEKLRQQPQVFDPAIEALTSIRLQQLTADEKKSFLINAYNFLVIKSIVDHYPMISPLDIDGFFDSQTFLVDGKQLTLNDIEHKAYHYCASPLVHFSLICAAKGCPPLGNEAFPSTDVEVALQNRAKIALNHSNFIRVYNKEQKVDISPIFKWFKTHFPKNTIEFINQYRDENIPNNYEINFYNYDWKLNQADALQSLTDILTPFFQQHVKDGMIDYKYLHQHMELFAPIQAEIEKVRFKNLTPNQLKAFLLNSYNFLVIKTISEHYPVTSPLDIEGFFNKKEFNINGRQVTLDNIEHKVYYHSKDPLVHFGLVCAARGCPFLNNKPFSSNSVDEELAAKATEMFDDHQFLIEDKAQNQIGLSFIFKWYSNHFPKDILAFVNTYKTIKVSPHAKVYYYNYNWKLNTSK